jgi:hypothetical protein
MVLAQIRVIRRRCEVADGLSLIFWAQCSFRTALVSVREFLFVLRDDYDYVSFLLSSFCIALLGHPGRGVMHISHRRILALNRENRTNSVRCMFPIHRESKLIGN